MPTALTEEEKTFSNFEFICNFIFIQISEITLDDTLNNGYKQNNSHFSIFLTTDFRNSSPVLSKY